MDNLPTKILLATDGSEDAALATRAAAELSSRTSSELYVVHAWRFVTPYSAYLDEMLKSYTHLNEQAAQKLLTRQVKRIEERGGTVTQAFLRQGQPIDVILNLGEELEPGLIVIGSRGLGSVGRLFLGSVSEGVVQHAPCPVLVLRGGQEGWPPERIIIGDDGSDPAKSAGELAAVIAGLFGSGTTLVRAYESPPEPIRGWSAQDRRKLDEALLREERALEKRAEELEAQSGSRPETRLIETEATLAMMLVAEEKEEEKTLIAVGSRGLGAARRAMLGSISTKVLRVARGPVLVCPLGRQTQERGGVVNCKERLENYLREEAVPFEVQHHPRAITAQEVAATEHVSGKMFAKTVMGLDDGKMLMLVLPAPYHVNPEKAAQALGGAAEFSLAGEEQFQDAFPDCEVGAMPPFGNLYGVTVYVDEALAENERLVFRAGTHTDTMSVRYADFERLVEPTLAEFADPPSA